MSFLTHYRIKDLRIYFPLPHSSHSSRPHTALDEKINKFTEKYEHEWRTSEEWREFKMVSITHPLGIIIPARGQMRFVGGIWANTGGELTFNGQSSSSAI